MKTTFVTVVLLLLAASAAQAVTLSTQWFAETWEGETPGNTIGSTATWASDGDIDSYLVQGPSGGNPGNYGGLGGANNSSWIWNEAQFGPSTTGKEIQIFTFDIEGGVGAAVGNRTEIYVLNSNYQVWGMWRGDGNSLTPRLGGAVAGATSATMLSGWNNEMTIVYNSTTGIMDWYHNGLLKGSKDAGVGNWMTHVEIHNNYAITDPPESILGDIHLDNIQVGVPEPATLVLLAMGGLFCARRRRA